MTKDELIALRRERSKQELNIGDHVKVYDRDGNIMYGGKVAIIIEKALLDPSEFYYGLYVEGETVEKFRGYALLNPHHATAKIGKTALLAPFFAEDLELMREPKPFNETHPLTVERARREMEEIASEIANDPEKAETIDKEWERTISDKNKPTDEIKCGDIVRVKRETPKDLYNNLSYDMPFFVAEIERDCDNPMNDKFLLRNGRTCLNIHPHWLEKWDAKTQPNDHTITIPVKADLDDTYWDAYRAELASKIAVAYAEKGRYKPSEIGEFAVMVANDVVDNLKKQSE